MVSLFSAEVPKTKFHRLLSLGYSSIKVYSCTLLHDFLAFELTPTLLALIFLHEIDQDIPKEGVWFNEKIWSQQDDAPPHYGVNIRILKNPVHTIYPTEFSVCSTFEIFSAKLKRKPVFSHFWQCSRVAKFLFLVFAKNKIFLK